MQVLSKSKDHPDFPEVEPVQRLSRSRRSIKNRGGNSSRVSQGNPSLSGEPPYAKAWAASCFHLVE